MMETTEMTVEPVFTAMAETAGLKAKGAYTLHEVSMASGVSVTALNDAVSSGALQTFLPPGRQRGRLVRPAWFDAWWAEGVE